MKFSGRRRDVEINMWGATSSRDELTGDLGDGYEAISIGVCDLFCRLAGKVVLHFGRRGCGPSSSDLACRFLHRCAPCRGGA